MAYVDAYVLPCPQDKVADYRRLARKAGTVWKDHGALQYMECVADDVEPGKSTSFPRAVKAKPGETVIVAFVVFRSRAARDRINAKVMADPRLASIGPKDMPFDTRRMFWGGFKPIVQA